MKIIAGVVTLALVSLFGLQHIAAQNVIPISYGDTQTGKLSTSTPSIIYAFVGSSGDLVNVVVTRTSGSLKPLVGIIDTNQPKGKEIIAVGKASADGTTSTITDFALTKSQLFGLIVTGDAKTVGGFSISLTNDSTGSSDSTATPTPGRSKPSPTPKKGSKATPTAAAPTNGVDNFTVGTSPTGLVWLNDSLFVANLQDSSVSVLDGDGNNTNTITTPSPASIATDGTNIWVANTGTDTAPGNSVSVFTPAGKKVGTYTVGKEPYSMSYDPDDQLMWIALYADKKVVGVNSKGKVAATVTVTTNPNTVLYAGSSVLWITLAGPWDTPNNTVMAINTQDKSTIGTLKVGKLPADLAWDSTDNILFVANYTDNTISALDVPNKKLNTIKTGTNPNALVWDGTHLWVALGGDNQVVALDTSGSVLTTIPLDKSPFSMIYDGNANVWVSQFGTTADPGNTVTRIVVATVLPN
jgi:YVTN family beta-propeller protein